MLRTKLVLMSVLVMLAGCAEGNSIYHNRALTDPAARVITVDAKQRNLLITKDSEQNWRMCAEAAPDVFSALSATASLEADVASKKGKAAAAIAESAGTIERTQTVNLLRESMYRTCERYLSGGLTRSTFVIQAARDQRTMLAVLAIEQLTRTARPNAVTLAAPGTSSAVANDDAIALIKKFSDEKADAVTAESDAKVAYANAKKASDCDTVTTAPAADPELSAWTTCVVAKKDLVTKTALATAASDRLDKIIGATENSGSTSAAKTAGVNTGGGGGAALSDAAVGSIAVAVRDIAMNSGLDEPLMFCIGYLSTPPVASADVQDSCLAIIKLRAQTDETARAQLMRYNISGVDFTVSNFHKPAPGDTATPILLAYVNDSKVSDAELTRRTRLAGDVAARLGLIKDSSELANFLAAPDALASQSLLVGVRAAETDAAGKAALTPQ